MQSASWSSSAEFRLRGTPPSPESIGSGTSAGEGTCSGVDKSQTPGGYLKNAKAELLEFKDFGWPQGPSKRTPSRSGPAKHNGRSSLGTIIEMGEGNGTPGDDAITTFCTLSSKFSPDDFDSVSGKLHGTVTFGRSSPKISFTADPWGSSLPQSHTVGSANNLGVGGVSRDDTSQFTSPLYADNHPYLGLQSNW
ncbi:hypothetical protein M231_03975 [Tremella mesenterica]|uniref:Uncharacterized protein n=1 Tax=Tremella mesenterica TaxID=5217 RepID=A0A4Q1BLW8_TREME|nr:hypothetical protein M231_03975 [Tremella mesenterica]